MSALPPPLMPCKKCRDNIGCEETGLCLSCDPVAWENSLRRGPSKKVEPPTPAESGLKKSLIINSRTTMDTANPTFAMYERLGLVCFSLMMSAEQKDGVWKKKPTYTRGWKKITATDVRPRENAFALRTGKEFGITAIDIDDPSLETSEKLMELMESCNMIAKTRKGFHYVFKYDDRLKQTTEQDKLDLDIRNDGGIIFCEPTSVKAPNGEFVANYEWTITPMDDEELQPVPDEVIEFLKELDPRYVNIVEVEEEEENVELPTMETTSTAASEPCDNELLVKLLHALSVKRLDNYDDWVKIGMVCFNENVPMEEWDTISKKSKKYQSGCCAQKWASFAKERKGRLLTQATLWKWLKTDDPIAFYSLMETRKDFWNLIALINHKDIAKYFYNICPDAYLYNENLGWFSITPMNIWKHSEKSTPSNLKRHIADTLQELAMDTKKAMTAKYDKVSSKITDEAAQKEALKKHQEEIKQIYTAYKMFGSSEFCNGVISFLPSFYEVDELEQLIDRNGYLFAFMDKVFDLNTNALRDILPSDYISNTTGYKAPSVSNKAIRKDIQSFLDGIFENDETRDYLLKVIASCIFGGNRWEQFYVLTGTGGNGKGVIATLLTNCFGGYYLSVDNSLFTKPVERKDQPIPALVEGRNKRIMMTSEPESDDRLQVGLLKKISGNDPVEARTLHSKHIVKYVAQYKILLQTNNIPKLSKIDKAVERRMRIIEFPFQFVANPTEPHHRKGNPDVKEKHCKSDAWRDEFMLMLMDIYKEIKNLADLPMPSSVKKKTHEYFDENNPLKLWLEKYYIITKKDTDKIQASLLKRDFLNDTHTEKFADLSFKNLLAFNGINQEHERGGNFYIGLKRKSDEELMRIREAEGQTIW